MRIWLDTQPLDGGFKTLRTVVDNFARSLDTLAKISNYGIVNAIAKLET
ncbi:MAG: hypothetical protein MUD14_17795 [Hydrococcus sp. Prado102]|jgi:hypothetical protein|nr:hypothetical protein [Hydrococcus sp. Prado102]